MGQDDPRRTMDATHYENAKAMQDRATGKPGALLGMHVSVVNERQRDGSYRPRRAFWWMPNHEITVTLVPISEKGTISQSNSRVFKVVNEVMSGVFQVDKNRVFIPLKDGQELLRLDEAPLVDTSAEPDAAVALPDVEDARRLQRPAQADQRGGAILAVRALAQGRQGGIDRRGIGIEFGQPLKETSPSCCVEREVGLRQLGGPVARRNLAAARGEAGTHLGCDILGLTTDHTLGHVAPQGRDAFQRPVEQSHIRGKVRHS